MPKLPSLHLLEAPAWQRERLQSWIEEWTLDLGLRGALQEIPNEVLAPAIKMFPDRALDLARPYDEEVEVRQIRLLGPTVAPDADRPICVAILGDTPDKLFLTAPFSRFGTPATPGEWLTGRDTAALRVLSIWNTRLFDSTYLKKSWLIGELSDAESAAAWEVFESQMAAQPMRNTLASQVGPPVVHPKDPRLLYQVEEAALFDAVAVVAEKPSSGVVTEFVALRKIYEAAMEEELPLAADSDEAPSREFTLDADSGETVVVRDIFEVPTYSLFIRMYLPPGRQNIVLVVLDSKNVSSEGLDGTIVIAKDGTALAAIEKGGAVLPLSAALSELGLRLASGELLLWRRWSK
jgi:hypothetical protein